MVGLRFFFSFRSCDVRVQDLRKIFFVLEAAGAVSVCMGRRLAAVSLSGLTSSMSPKLDSVCTVHTGQHESRG